MAMYFVLAVVVSMVAGSLIHVLIEKRILYALKNVNGRSVKRDVASQVDNDAV